MQTYQITHPTKILEGEIELNGSKSISNRLLIIEALARRTRRQEDERTGGPESFTSIANLSNANDTLILEKLLKEQPEEWDAGPAGTTFRFLTAYLAIQEGTQVLTGSERMKQRPIYPLVGVLRKLGARIDYLGEEGYPPLRIGPPSKLNSGGVVEIGASVSSQFISALLLIGPYLPQGLRLRLSGLIVSRPYIEMTLKLMEQFGIQHTWEGQVITVDKGTYKGSSAVVEADWSAASYYYAMAALSKKAHLFLKGLFEDSIQGDAHLAELLKPWGIRTLFHKSGVEVVKERLVLQPQSTLNFVRIPDLAQTFAVLFAGIGQTGLFTGLETLKIKETDRVEALQKELKKLGVDFREIGHKGAIGDPVYELSNRAVIDHPTFRTYEDHRMAMAFAPLALLGTINIEDPEVVKKSYSAFWKDLERLGFEIKAL